MCAGCSGSASRNLPPHWHQSNTASRALPAQANGIRMMIAHRIYHLDGVACHDPGSCWGRKHTTIPPRCAAEPASELAGGLVVCDLPKGYPGPHLHVATKLEFWADRPGPA